MITKFKCSVCEKYFLVDQVKEYYQSPVGRCFCCDCFKKGLRMSPQLFYKEKFKCVPGGSWGAK